MSGAERFVKETIERLRGKYRFFIITARLRSDLPTEEDFEGYKVIRVGRGDKWDKLRYIWLAPRKAKKFNPQLIHAVMESYAGLALWLAKYAVMGTKRILTLQSGDLDRKIWSKILVLWGGIHKSPDFVTAISRFLADRAYRLGAKKVEIIPNGVDLGEINDVLASRGGNIKHRIVILARLSWEKDHKNLVAAMPRILSEYPDTEMVFVGDGPEKHNLEFRIQNLGLKDKIKFLGNLPHKTALEELAKADVFVCPSLAEGLGIVFIEAQALGVPVIGTSVGGIQDVITDNETGLLIKPGSSGAIAEAILKIFRMSPEEKNKMIERAMASVAEKFNWDNIAAKIDKIYNALTCE